MPLKREAEIRLLVESVVNWQNKRGQLTTKINDILNNSTKILREGRDAVNEVNELRAAIIAGNAANDGTKLKIRELLSELLAEFKANRDKALAESREIRLAAGRELSSFLGRWATLAALNTVNRDEVRDFNALVNGIERQIVEGGEGGLARAREALFPPVRPSWEFGAFRDGKIELGLKVMAEILT